jgi:pimeloyl-ACP methyl ester carboxylesterase
LTDVESTQPSETRLRLGGIRVLRRLALEGSKPAGRVIMVHGAMDRATSFTRLWAKLPDCEVIAYDRRGYGHSSGVQAPPDFAVQVADLVDVASTDGGSGPVVAFGHSLGGDIVLAALERYPGIFAAAVIWEAPMPWLESWPQDTPSRGAGAQLGPEERAEWFMRRMVGDRLWERLPAATRCARRSEGVTLDTDFAYLADGAVFDAAAIAVPVTVGFGGKSRPHQRMAAKQLASSLSCSSIVEIPDAGHGAHLSHPKELADLIRQLF